MFDFFAQLPEVAGPHVATIIGLIFLDLAIAVAAAVRSGTFDWRAIAAFYRSNVVPFIIGYLGLLGAMEFVSLDLLPAEIQEALPLITAWIGFGAIVAQIFASVKLGVEALVAGTSKYETWEAKNSAKVEVEVMGLLTEGSSE